MLSRSLHSQYIFKCIAKLLLFSHLCKRNVEKPPFFTPIKVKQARLSKLMRVQQQISAEVQEAKVGQEMKVVIDRKEGDYFIGRTEFDSPEVDPEVLIPQTSAPNLQPGMFVRAKIESADDFDLYAAPLTHNAH